VLDHLGSPAYAVIEALVSIELVITEIYS